jgi:5'-deoxynucleotidase YfbR-like HD superfamily hydrolase
VHDLGESVVGDVAAPEKEKSPDWLIGHGKAETKALCEMGFEIDLNAIEQQRLFLVDKLDAYLFANLRAFRVVERCPKWQADRGKLERLSSDLGVAAVVMSMVSA